MELDHKAVFLEAAGDGARENVEHAPRSKLGFERRMNRIGAENSYRFAIGADLIHRLLHRLVIDRRFNTNKKHVVVGLPNNRLRHDPFEIYLFCGKGRQEIAQASHMVF